MEFFIAADFLSARLRVNIMFGELPESRSFTSKLGWEMQRRWPLAVPNRLRFAVMQPTFLPMLAAATGPFNSPSTVSRFKQSAQGRNGKDDSSQVGCYLSKRALPASA